MLLHPFRPVERELCDGCKRAIPIGSQAFIRSDSAVFCTKACEAKHSDARPSTRMERQIMGSDT